MEKELRIGIVGFDTSHVPAFTKLLGDSNDPFFIPGGKIVAGFPSFSPDLEASASRVEGFKKEMTEKLGVKLVNSVEELIAGVDAVLIESVDGRRHLKEAGPVIKARKPLFIDKPLSANYQEAAEIVRLAKENSCPLFSSSSLRFDANIARVKEDPELGEVFACDAFSPATLDPTNPGLFWYGVHGVEILYTFMGPGCQRVTCYKTDNYHLVVGHWQKGRIATVRGIRCGAGDYGATVFGAKKVSQVFYSREIPIYSQLLRKIMPFFKGGPAPVAPEETLEIMAFMEAALLSEKEHREVALKEVMKN